MEIRCETRTPNELAQVVTVGEHQLAIDVPEELFGKGSAPDPHDLFDAALAGCKATTAHWYARTKNIPLERVEVHVERDASRCAWTDEPDHCFDDIVKRDDLQFAGAGKTRTLVKRLAGLLAENVDPSSILVLTFSNRAAGELAERITAIAGEAAPRIWIGTFHAFGLDVIRRHHTALELPADPVLFDRSDAIAVLEEILPTLPLMYYRNLWDPALILKEILSAISRAKDEVIDAAGYRALAQSMAADER